MRRVLILVFLSVLCACGGRSPNTAATRSPSPALDLCTDDNATAAVAAAQVAHFTTSDGNTLTGALWGSGRGGVVLGHMGMGSLCQWAAYGLRLSKRGVMVMAIDFRGYGKSPMKDGDPWRMDLDMAGGVAELRRRGATRIVIGGGSLGGVASIQAAGEITPTIDGVVDVAGPMQARTMDAKPVLGKITMPVLFLIGNGDNPGFVDDARYMLAHVKSASKRLVLLETTEHGTDMFKSPVATQFESTLTGFILKCLG